MIKRKKSKDPVVENSQIKSTETSSAECNNEEVKPRANVIKRRKKGSTDKLYFNADTQKAIIAYQNAPDDKKERTRLYVEEILPAFEKLVENLINIHKFTSLHDSYDDLKTDCVNFLFETIGKFDGSRGTNAFSYFNVVSKNWLIIRTKQKALRIKRSVSIDDHDALSNTELKIIEDYCTIPSQESASDHENTISNVVEILQDIRNKAKSENELLCINSIITIFENIDDIDLLNKSSVLLYMRELSGLSPKQLTITMQNIKRYYRKSKAEAKSKLP